MRLIVLRFTICSSAVLTNVLSSTVPFSLCGQVCRPPKGPSPALPSTACRLHLYLPVPVWSTAPGLTQGSFCSRPPTPPEGWGGGCAVMLLYLPLPAPGTPAFLLVNPPKWHLGPLLDFVFFFAYSFWPRFPQISSVFLGSQKRKNFPSCVQHLQTD